MGDLAVKYGFYGADGGTEGGSESLLVNDPQEVFIFHILPDDTGTSAIWVAQRVPDDHIAVVANMFTIRAVNLTDSFNFLGSANMHEIAQRHGLWSPKDGLLDFTKTFSDGEYGHRYYSGRRMWGAFALLSPQVKLPDTYTNLKEELVYPATIPVTTKLTPQDVMRAHRSYYEGTKYDQTVGLAAGPWGLPDRFPTDTDLTGNWERTISIYRTAYSHITQARPVDKTSKLQAGIVWFGPHVASTTVYMPYSIGVNSLAPSLGVGSPDTLSRESVYWAMKNIYNLKRMKHAPMMVNIKALQSQLESLGAALVAKLDEEASSLNADELSAAYADHATSVFTSWWKLSDTLMEKYADGEDGASYPDWWLKAVGYQNGPPDQATVF